MSEKFNSYGDHMQIRSESSYGRVEHILIEGEAFNVLSSLPEVQDRTMIKERRLVDEAVMRYYDKNSK